MSSIIVSTVLQVVEQLSPDIAGVQMQGALLSIYRIFSSLLASTEVEAIEVFLPPSEYQRQDALASVANSILPPGRRGKGALRFYPISSLPEVWADHQPRVLLSVDLAWLARDRYLRDRFATAAMPISCQTHGLGDIELYRKLRLALQGPPVPYDTITCLSEACKQSLLAALDGYLLPQGSPLPCRFDVLPNGVDDGLFHVHSAEERASARRLLGLPLDATIALYFGRLTPNSKADLLPLLRRFAKASRTNDHLVLAGVENIAGYGARLAAEAAELGFPERFHLRLAPDLRLTPLFYGAADLFVFPCDNAQECLGNTVLEAIASGLPVIASNWDGLRDSIQDGETGFLIPTYAMPGMEVVEAISPAQPFMSSLLQAAQCTWVDAERLEGALRTLLTDHEKRTAMGMAGRRRIEAEYGWPRIASRMLALWKDLLLSAESEPHEDRDRRRANADAIGMPVPYSRLLAPYATGSFPPDARLRLSDYGAGIADRKERLTFYDETLPTLRPPLVDALIAELSIAGPEGRTAGDLVQTGAAATGLSIDSAKYHLALLLKRDVLEIVPVAST